MKPFFPIVMWLEASPKYMGYNEQTAPEFFRRSFEDIAYLHCNTIRPSNLPLPYVDLLLTTAAEYELKVILDPQWGHNLMRLTPAQILADWEMKKVEIKRDVIDPFAGYENLLGYAVTDEPPADKLEQWKLIVKMFHELDPNHPDYTCFNRPLILAEVVNDESVILERIAYDNYPHEKSVPLNTMGTHPEFGWYNMYKNFYKACQARPHVPQISIVAVFKNGNPWRKPTETEFRTTVYTSLVAGAKGIVFFAYMDFKNEKETLECLVDSNWNPYPLYPAVKAAAVELEQLGPELAGLQPCGNVTGWNTTSRTLRCKYNNSSQRRYFIIANKDPNPDESNITGYLQLEGPVCYVEDIGTKEIFRANTQCTAEIPLPSAYGRVLKEMIGPAPFGFFESPQHGSKDLAGAISVTGWALSDVGVTEVKIKRAPVPGDPGSIIENDGLVFIGKAEFIEGVRPDVAQKYPDYPHCQRAGWGYSMLTNFLPNHGNGTFELHAIAYDIDGNSIKLGQKTITCNNAEAKKPFGTIESPGPMGIASGKQYKNWGWVLTAPPNLIPYDGTTISVFIDGTFIGHPIYDIPRADIVRAFPGCLNNQDGHGGVGYLVIDTTAFENGVHTIYWFVVDNAGNKDGIGSRYFRIEN